MTERLRAAYRAGYYAAQIDEGHYLDAEIGEPLTEDEAVARLLQSAPASSGGES